MKKRLSALGCFALLATVATAQQSTIPTPPPAKGGMDDPARTSPAPSQEKDTIARDRLTTESSRFKALDTDGDNRVSRSEFTLAPNLLLQTGDTEPGSTDRSKEPVEGRHSESQVASGATDSTFRSSGTSSFELFNQLDTDKDGFLSPAELAADPNTKVKE